MKPLRFVLPSAVILLLLIGQTQAAMLYGVGNFSDSELVQIDTTTGIDTLIGNLGSFSTANSLAINSSGTLYTVAGNQLVTINSTTGAASLVTSLNFGFGPGQFPLGIDVRGLSFSPTGVLHAIQVGTVGGNFAAYLYTINTVTGVGTLLGNTNLGGGQLLAFGPDGTLYGWDGATISGTNRGLVTYNTTTGAFTDVSLVNGSFGLNLQALTYGSDGNFYAATQTNLYQMNVMTGVTTLISSGTLSDLRGLAGAPLASAVPEPSSLALLGIGVIGLLGYLKRQRR